jgi:hypothetical protein
MANIMNWGESAVPWICFGVAAIALCGWFLLLIICSIHDYIILRRITRKPSYIRKKQ